MDRTAACGAADVGSIPTEGTRDTNACPAAGFVLLCRTQRCFAIAKTRVGVANEFADEQIRFVTTKETD